MISVLLIYHYCEENSTEIVIYPQSLLPAFQALVTLTLSYIWASYRVSVSHVDDRLCLF